MGIESTSPPAPVGRRLLIAVCLLLALGFGLRTVDIWLKPDIPGVVAAPDEGYSVLLATGSWAELFRQTAADTHPPFYYALLKVWFVATPDTQTSARFLSVLFSTGTLIYVFLLGRRLFGNAAGICGLAFAALAPYQIYWGHLARMHAVLPLFAAMIVYHTLLWLEEGRRRDWLLCALGWVLAVQTNYMGLVFGAVWGVAVLAWSSAPWRQRLLLLPAGLVGLVTFLPWLHVVFEHVGGGPMNHNFFQETVSPVYLYYHALFGVMHPYQPNQQGIAYVFFLLFAIVFVAGIAPAGRRPGLWVLLLLGPTLPIVIAKTQSWTLAERHLLFTLPLFMAYWGAGCVALWAYLRGRLKRAPGE